MLDIQKLERRWLAYKVKSYLPFLLGVSAVFFLSFIIIYTLNKQESSSPALGQESDIPKNIQKTPVKMTNSGSSTNTLEPSMEFIQSFSSSTPAAIIPAANTPKHMQISSETIPAPKVLSVPDSSTLKSAGSADKAVSLNRNESKLDIESIERRFKENSNPNLGLFIARYHYDHGNYNEAYNFALKTNSINNKMDESWIIFSKSLVKLGKAEQAKKTLQLYISESGSNSARAVLDSIEQGSFK